MAEDEGERDENDPGEVASPFATKGLGWCGRDKEDEDDPWRDRTPTPRLTAGRGSRRRRTLGDDLLAQDEALTADADVAPSHQVGHEGAGLAAEAAAFGRAGRQGGQP